MAAVVLLGADWWGTLTASCEASRGRRSCLLLSVMRPGASAAPWLGALDQLGPAEEGTTSSNYTVKPISPLFSYQKIQSCCSTVQKYNKAKIK